MPVETNLRGEPRECRPRFDSRPPLSRPTRSGDAAADADADAVGSRASDSAETALLPSAVMNAHLSPDGLAHRSRRSRCSPDCLAATPSAHADRVKPELFGMDLIQLSAPAAPLVSTPTMRLIVNWANVERSPGQLRLVEPRCQDRPGSSARVQAVAHPVGMRDFYGVALLLLSSNLLQAAPAQRLPHLRAGPGRALRRPRGLPGVCGDELPVQLHRPPSTHRQDGTDRCARSAPVPHPGPRWSRRTDRSGTPSNRNWFREFWSGAGGW